VEEVTSDGEVPAVQIRNRKSKIENHAAH